MTSPRLTYDPQANAVYIRLSDNTVSETLELSVSTYVDVDEAGSPVGFEILHADPELLAGISANPEGVTLRDLLKPNAA